MAVCLRCGRPTDDHDTADYCPDCLALIAAEDDEHEEDADDYLTLIDAEDEETL